MNQSCGYIHLGKQLLRPSGHPPSPAAHVQSPAQCRPRPSEAMMSHVTLMRAETKSQMDSPQQRQFVDWGTGAICGLPPSHGHCGEAHDFLQQHPLAPACWELGEHNLMGLTASAGGDTQKQPGQTLESDGAGTRQQDSQEPTVRRQRRSFQKKEKQRQLARTGEKLDRQPWCSHAGADQ